MDRHTLGITINNIQKTMKLTPLGTWKLNVLGITQASQSGKETCGQTLDQNQPPAPQLPKFRKFAYVYKL